MLGFRGRVTAPGPDFFDLVHALCAGLNRSSLSLWRVAWSASSAALVRRSGTLGSRGLLSH